MPFGLNTLAINAMTLVVLLALLYPFLFNDRAKLIDVVSIYRPLALAFLALNPTLVLLAPFTSRALLPIAIASIAAAMASLALEIRSTRRPVPDAALWFVWGLFLVVSLVTEVRWDFGRSPPQSVGYVTGLTSVLILWSGVEAILAYSSTRNRNYLLVISCALIAAGGMFARAWLLAHGEHSAEAMMLYEDGWLFITRAVALSGLVAMSIVLSQLYLDNEWKNEELSRQKVEDGLLRMLGALSLVRDEETGAHIKRTSEFVRTIAQGMRDRGLLESEAKYDIVDVMSRAAPLHDIGKIGIPDAILKKPGQLDEQEWVTMKTHAAMGEEVIKAAADVHTRSDGYMDFLMQIAADIAGGHHENWDGSGYPRGLSGKAIPEAARIMAVADVYDALTSPRVYKQRWSHADAVIEINRLSGSKFDPNVVDTFVELERNFSIIADKYQD